MGPVERYFSGGDKGRWDDRRIPWAKLTRIARRRRDWRWTGGEKNGEGFPVWNMASETTTEVRSEKCFAADMELGATPSGDKRFKKKKKCCPSGPHA